MLKTNPSNRESSVLAEERARLAIESAALGTFDVDLVNNLVVSSDRMHEIFNIDLNNYDRNDFVNRIHPEDLSIREKAYKLADKTGELSYQVRLIWRDGSLHWIDVKGKYFYNESHTPIRLIGIVNDITSQKLFANAAAETERKFRNTVHQAPVGIAILSGRDFVFTTANNNYLMLIDKHEDQVIGKKLFDILPEVKGVVEPLLLSVLDTGVAFNAPDLRVSLNRYGKEEFGYFNLIYQPLYEGEVISGIVVVANEVTDLVIARHTLEERQRQFSNFIMRSPIAMTVWRGPDHIIEMANETMFKQIWRKEPKDIIGKKALDVFPELNNQRYPELLKKVYETGHTHRENEAMALVQGDDGLRKFFLDFEYAPLLEANGNTSGIMITVYDVTEKVESRQKLIDAESRMRLAVEGTELSTWDLNLETRAIIHSPRLSVIFGHPESKVLTHSEMREQLHPDDRTLIVDKAFDGALQTGSYEYESRIIRPDKSIRWIRTRGKVVFENEGKPARMLGTLMDITDIKLASEQSSRLAAIVQSSDDAIISKRLDGTITSWNQGAERLFGYTPEEIIGKSILTLIPADRVEEEPAIIARLISGERVDHIETVRVSKHGKLIELSLSISPIRDQFGKIIGASKIARDITAQKNAERKMEEDRLHLETIIEASALGIWELDLVNGSPKYSKRYLEILGFKDSQAPTHVELLQRLHPEDMAVREKAFKVAMQTGKLFYVARLIWPDGTIRWMEGRGNVFFEDGKAAKMTGTVRDITEEKAFSQALEIMVEERTRELKHANVELEKMNQELASFAYVSSHDLQEPLRKIQAFASRVMEKEYQTLSAAGKDYFARMQEAARRMQLLIQDLLAYSRTNKKEKEFIQTNLSFLVSGVVDDLEQYIHEKHATINIGAMPEVSVIPFQFRQLFTNLISNSLKFRQVETPLVIDIQSERIEAGTDDFAKLDPERSYHKISVRDNGIGFDNSYGERIFEVFQRLHTRQEYEGTGIGLAICKKIVENHQGFIAARGESGKGATFIVYLPA